MSTQSGTRSFIEAGWSTHARADYVAKESGRSRSLVFENGYDLAVLTQFWCSFDTCGTLAGIDDKSVISRNPFLRSEQGDASPRVQDRPGLGHGG
jgi:hypothetical protein